MSILDQVLEASTEARIVSVNNDLGQINVGDVGAIQAGYVDSALAVDRRGSANLKAQITSIENGTWDEGEYGISRSAQIVKLRVALEKAEAIEAEAEAMVNNPDKRAELIRKACEQADAAIIEMRNRAIRRANIDTSNGRVNVAIGGGKPAWHTLGTYFDKAMTREQAQKASGTSHGYVKLPTFSINPVTGAQVPSTETFAIHRDDTGEFMSNVGSDWKIWQPNECYDVMEVALEDYGAKFASAGSLDGGRRIFICVELPEQSFVLGERDGNQAYAILTNPYMIGMGWLYPAFDRAECENTVRVGLTAAKAKGLALGMRHTGSIGAKVAEMKKALGLAVKEMGAYKTAAEKLAATPLVNEEKYFADVLDACLDVTAAQAAAGFDLVAAMAEMEEAEVKLAQKKFDNEVKARANILEEILNIHHSEKGFSSANGTRNTLWHGVNSVTNFTNHSKSYRHLGTAEAKATRRLDSILGGERDEMNQAAFKTAVALSV